MVTFDRAAAGTSTAETLLPLQEPVTSTGANFGKANITYVYKVDDHALGYQLQQEMVKRANVQRVYALPYELAVPIKTPRSSRASRS